MITNRMTVKRFEDEGVNEEVPPQNDQVPIGGEGNDVPVVPLDITNGEIIKVLLALARVTTTHVNRGVEPRVNALEGTMTSILGDFVRMNPPIFLCSMVGEDV